MDTLNAARALESAGFDRKQAEAIASTVNGLASGNFATKADLYQAAFAIVVANAAVTFGLLKMVLP